MLDEATTADAVGSPRDRRVRRLCTDALSTNFDTYISIYERPSDASILPATESNAS
jgi:hypothetical protein